MSKCGTANNVYVGARYVPLILGEWDATLAYEPLSVVLYKGTSYTSRTYVPKGVEPSETTSQYWALTGNYNAQVEIYRQEVERYGQEVELVKTTVDQLEQEVNEIKPFITRTYDTTKLMLLDTTINSGLYVQTLGYESINDGGGAVFYITDTVSETNFQFPLNGLYANLVIFNGLYNIKTMGAVENSEIGELINKVIGVMQPYDTLLIPRNNYVLSSTITINKPLKIIGENYQTDTTNIKVNATLDNAILISGNYTQISNLSINGGNMCTNGIGTDTTRSRIKLNNLTIDQCTNGYNLQIYMSELDQCMARECENGLSIHGNLTTNTEMTSVFVHNCQMLNCTNGYLFNRLTYSTVTACGADANTVAYTFDLCTSIYLNACGSERNNCSILFTGSSSASISINGFKALGNTDSGKYVASILCEVVVNYITLSGFAYNNNTNSYFLKVYGQSSYFNVLDNSMPRNKIYYGTNNDYPNVVSFPLNFIVNPTTAMYNSPPTMVGIITRREADGVWVVSIGTSSVSDWVRLIPAN